MALSFNPVTVLGSDFYTFLLPWVFTFAIVYGLLVKGKFFDNPKVTGVLSLVVAFFIIGFGGPWLAAFFVNLFGYAAVILAGILVIALFITMSGGDMKKFFDNKGVAAILVGLGIIILFIALGGSIVVVADGTIGILFIIILMAVAVYFIAGNK